MKPTIAVLTVLVVSVVASLNPFSVAQEKKERRLEVAYNALLSTGDFKETTLKRDFNLLSRFVSDGTIVEPRVMAVFTTKEFSINKGPAGLASAWAELRLGPDAIGKDEPLSLTALLQGVEQMVILKIKSDPPDAKVYLRKADNYVGDTELEAFVTPGKLRVILDLDKHEKSDEEIDVPKKNYTYEKKLKRKS